MDENELLKANWMMIVAYVARNKRLWRHWMEHDDAIQFAAIGFLNAARKFNPDLGIKLSTYAWNGMSFALRTAIRKERTRKKNFGEWKCGDLHVVDRRPIFLTLAQRHEEEMILRDLINDVEANTNDGKRRCEVFMAKESGKTYVEIGKSLGITKERARQIGTEFRQKVMQLRNQYRGA